MRSGLVTVAFGLIVAALVLTGRGGEAQTTAGIYIADRGNGRACLHERHDGRRVDGLPGNDITGAGWVAFGTAGSGPKQFNLPGFVFVR